MTTIAHKQAKRYLRAAADGLLRENQRALLNGHLLKCDTCRDEADELNALEMRLKKNLQARWDAYDGPSENVLTNIQSQKRRIIMSNRINSGLKTFAGVTALLLLGLLFIPVIRQLQEYSQQNNSIPGNTLSTPQPFNGLIAFTSQKNGNLEIYSMHADGSNVINLTNKSAADFAPAWSPDGKKIAFISNRTDPANVDIFVMNSDGKELTQLTDNPGYDEILSWSPDGQKIVVLSNQGGHLSNEGQLIVMNVDGSNKIPLTSEPGSYNFLGWSPDGQKIVYQAMSLGNNEDSRIMVASVDGTSTFFDGPFFEGDGGRMHDQIHWETSEQFITLSSNSEQPTWGMWNLTRFYTTEEGYTNSIGSNPILVYSDSPIVAIFDRTYVVESQDALTWFVYEGAPIPFSPWKFSEICKTPGDPNLQETSHFISPDKKHSFVSVYCGDDNGSVSFFLMNEDGTEIHQLGMPVTNTISISGDVSWSPDGKYVIVTIASSEGTNADLYLFDIEKMLNDPSTQPVQLTTDGALKYGVTWQPVVNNDIVEEKPTPTPLTFSLTASEAETLAGFDILEPSYLPAGYTFDGASYDLGMQQAALQYVSPSVETGGSGTLYIFQKRGKLLHDPAVQAYVTPVSIGNIQGEYIRGAWVYDSPDTTTPKWDVSADVYSFSWQKGEIVFSINFLGGETIPTVQLHELVTIAESMK